VHRPSRIWQQQGVPNSFWRKRGIRINWGDGFTGQRWEVKFTAAARGSRYIFQSNASGGR